MAAPLGSAHTTSGYARSAGPNVSSPRRSTTSIPRARSSAGEVAHGAQDELAPLTVVAQPGEGGARLDHQHAVGALQGGVGVRELVAEDQRGVPHQPAIAR